MGGDGTYNEGVRDGARSPFALKKRTVADSFSATLKVEKTSAPARRCGEGTNAAGWSGREFESREAQDMGAALGSACPRREEQVKKRT